MRHTQACWEAYGRNRGFRDWLADREVPFVLAIRSDYLLTCPDGRRHEAKALAGPASTLIRVVEAAATSSGLRVRALRVSRPQVLLQAHPGCGRC